MLEGVGRYDWLDWRHVGLELYFLSSNLKTFEVGIWKQKLSTTQNDVLKYIQDEKKARAIAVDTLIKPQVNDDCSRKLDTVLDMLSIVLHLVKVAENNKVEGGSVPLDSREYFFSENVGGGRPVMWQLTRLKAALFPWIP